MSSVWDGVDLAVIRDVTQDHSRTLVLTLDRNLFGGQSLLFVATTDPFNPRRKPIPVLPGPLIGSDHAAMLRAVADVLDGTIQSLPVSTPESTDATGGAA